MSPFSAPVLLGAAIISSPALYSALVAGTTSLETAAVRYLISAGLVWAGLAFLSMLIGPTPRAVTPETAEALADAEATQQLAASDPEAA